VYRALLRVYRALLKPPVKRATRSSKFPFPLFFFCPERKSERERERDREGERESTGLCVYGDPLPAFFLRTGKERVFIQARTSCIYEINEKRNTRERGRERWSVFTKYTRKREREMECIYEIHEREGERDGVYLRNTRERERERESKRKREQEEQREKEEGGERERSREIHGAGDGEREQGSDRKRAGTGGVGKRE